MRVHRWLQRCQVVVELAAGFPPSRFGGECPVGNHRRVDGPRGPGKRSGPTDDVTESGVARVDTSQAGATEIADQRIPVAGPLGKMLHDVGARPGRVKGCHRRRRADQAVGTVQIGLYQAGCGDRIGLVDEAAGKLGRLRRRDTEVDLIDMLHRCDAESGHRPLQRDSDAPGAGGPGPGGRARQAPAPRCDRRHPPPRSIGPPPASSGRPGCSPRRPLPPASARTANSASGASSCLLTHRSTRLDCSSAAKTESQTHPFIAGPRRWRRAGRTPKRSEGRQTQRLSIDGCRVARMWRERTASKTSFAGHRRQQPSCHDEHSKRRMGKLSDPALPVMPAMRYAESAQR